MPRTPNAALLLLAGLAVGYAVHIAALLTGAGAP